MNDSGTLCTFYIVRHGETEWNRRGLVQGHTDTDLNELGETQAKERAEHFRSIKFDAVFSSDLTRARRTAQILVQGRPLRLQTTPVLREQYWGKWEGHSFDSIRDQFGHNFNAYTSTEIHGVPEVESHFTMAKRVLPFLHELSGTFHGQNLLVVTHGGVMKSILYHMSFEQYGKIGFKNLDYIKLTVKNGDLILDEVCGVQAINT